MKYIILFLLFSFSAFGNYAKLSEVETNSISKVFVKMKRCGADCIKIPFGYNKNYHRAIDEMVNDTDSPINSKNDIEACAGQPACEAALPSKICTDSEEVAYIDAGFSEMYCSKVTGYNQKLSGRKVVVEDAGLKAAHMASEQSAKDAKAAKKSDFMTLKAKLDGGGTLTPPELSEYLRYLSRNEQ